MALALNSEGLGVNANRLDFTVCEHVWLGGRHGGWWVPFSLNTLCVIGVLFSNYSLNEMACGTTLYEKVSHRWV